MTKEEYLAGDPIPELEPTQTQEEIETLISLDCYDNVRPLVPEQWNKEFLGRAVKIPSK